MVTKSKLISSVSALSLAGLVGQSFGAGVELEEVVVTATKRAQSLQDIPVAVTVFGAETLERNRISNVGDVATKTPGFYISHQSPSDPEMTIRGIGSSGRESGSDRSVVMFIDEIYIGRSGGSTVDLFDIEQIEVLRGPQGTLFGRNVVGGAISVTTAKPTDVTALKLRAGLGSHELYEVGLSWNAPISDKLFSRFSLSKKDRDGYVTNINDGKKSDNVDNLSFRGALRFLPSDELEMQLTAEYSTDEVDGVHTKLPVIGGPFSLIDDLFAPSDFHKVTMPVLGFLDRDVWGLTGRLDWSMGLGTFTSLTSYRVVDFQQNHDLAGGTAPGSFCAEPTLDATEECFLSLEIIDERSSTFTHEFRLSSDSDGPFNWIAGLYYLKEETDRDQERKRLLSFNGSITSSDPLFDQLTETESYAVFGEMNYDITENLTLTVGARWTHDEKTLDLDVIDLDPNRLRTNALNPAQEIYSVSGQSESWEEVTPKVSLTYNFTDSAMAYVTWSEGYKSGGYNGLAGQELATRTAFEPETATNIEVGLKSQFWDDRVRLNLSAYHMSFENLQLRRRLLLDPNDQTSNTIAIANAKEATIKGIEAELTFIPVEPLRLSATYAFTDSELSDGTVTVAGFANVSDDGLVASEGDPLPRAPENAFTLAAEYALDLPSGELNLQIDYGWVDDVYFDLGTPEPYGMQEAYGLTNASIKYTPNEGNWDVTFWAKNLADEEYYAQLQAFSGGSWGVGRVGDPRTYGMTVIWTPEL